MHDDSPLSLAGAPRWRGGPHRLEVHYLTATDALTGAGLWLHHEVVAPTTGSAYAHGWVATFPPGAAPQCTRFGPAPATPVSDGVWFRAGDVEMTATTARGRAGDVEWDLQWAAEAPPLWTFPRWAWRRRLLPAAQVLPVPTTRVTGAVGTQRYDGPGGVAHIDGHGNAQRWVWLHCALGDGALGDGALGDGALGGADVLEVVAATARRPGLRALSPLPLVQLRADGRDWPRDPLAAAPLFRARVGERAFAISGVVGRQRLRVDVTLPADACVVLDYTDPDGATATCTNSERANATVHVDRLTGGGWRSQHRWVLAGTAHAEIGTRPE